MDAARAIAAEVDPEQLEFGSGRLVGSVSQHDFRLRGVRGDRNWMRPVIEGTILPRPDGCAISIAMTVPRHAALLVAALLVLILVSMVAVLFVRSHATWRARLLLSGLLLSHAAIVVFSGWKSFVDEARKAEEILTDILGARRAL